MKEEIRKQEKNNEQNKIKKTRKTMEERRK